MGKEMEGNTGCLLWGTADTVLLEQFCAYIVKDNYWTTTLVTLKMKLRQAKPNACGPVCDAQYELCYWSEVHLAHTEKSLETLSLPLNKHPEKKKSQLQLPYEALSH